ncbi:MAG: hypothetical protein HYT77_08025 [Deltaproteobacteria bacterium]|nr:hypothetical protein [Deltaproteobacteria bacterium]
MRVIARDDSRIYKLPLIFSDGAIFQRNREIPISGTCYKKDVIEISVDTISQKTQCRNGWWLLAFPPMPAGGPYDISVHISGERVLTHVIKNIYYGEVWIAAGQSNMSRQSEIPEIQFTLPVNVFYLSPYSYCFKHWKKLQNLSEFSAVASHFSIELSDRIKVPIGIILIAEGSSTIAHWHPYNDSSYYNSTIKKLYPLPFRGVIWWQGESDALGPSYSLYKKIKPQLRSWIRQLLGWNWEGPGNLYLTKKYDYNYLFTSLIEEWREDWGIGDFPFIFVQLQKLVKENNHWIKVRQAQENALQLPKTAMVISYDITDGELHPADTKPVALRLADTAARFYKDSHAGLK